MPVVSELIRIEDDGTISFGNYMLAAKSKLQDFEFQGDLYKVKTFGEITKLERNGMFVYESVPGTAVNHFQAGDTSVQFSVEGEKDAQITIQLEDERANLALVDKFESWMDGTCMELDENDHIENFIPGKYLKFSEKENYYKTVNIYKFSADFSQNIYVPFLTAYEKAMGDNEYYESVIKLIAMLETREIQAKRLTGQVWYEIDNIQDLNIAESLFNESESEHYEKIARRYGGFWRYPKLLDYCYLVNPYYPPVKLKEEMKSNFETLLTEYPSGMEVNALLAAGAFGVNPEHIIVGNGAAELIKGLLEYLSVNADRKVGCIYPTFEEYPNRLKKESIVPFVPAGEAMHYTVEDLMP